MESISPSVGRGDGKVFKRQDIYRLGKLIDGAIRAIDKPAGRRYARFMADRNKRVAWLLALIMAAGPAFAQTVTEVAKKEKARRESAKKGAVVVTNADLSRTKKKAAMVGMVPATPPAGEEEGPPPDIAPPSAVAAPSTVPAGKTEAEVAGETSISFEEKKAELAAVHDRARERTELLDLKMRALNQQLFTFNSMSTKDQIQKSIAETYQKLQEAQAEADKAKADLEKFLNQAASSKAPAVWIKKP